MHAKPSLAPVRNRSSVLQDATVREFGGGWNVVDNDLNLSTRFATLLDNMSREEDGSMGIRWGTELLADICTQINAPADVHIINTIYFQDAIVTVLSDGRLTRTLGDGTTTVIWDTAIAGGLLGAPAAWGPTDFASFAIFNGRLIVCNGTDKPLITDFTNAKPVQYLADEATGSNVNVPICRYVVAMNTYLVMAGDALYPDRVHISNQNTSGTWFGDAAPNDGTFVDLGKVGVQGEQIVTGVNRYRDQLVVSFFSASVLGKLGIYTELAGTPVHKPNFDDVIEGFGCHAHRSMVNLGNDLFMLDNQGITSIARSLYSGATEPKRVSELIDPEINANVNRLLEVDTLLGAHAVYNNNDKQYMCFLPNHSEFQRKMITDPFEVLRDRNNALRARIPSHGLLVGDTFTISGATSWNDVNAATMLNGIDHVVTRVINDGIIEFEPPGMVTDENKTLIGGGNAAQWMPRWTETLGYIYTFVNELKIRAWARYRGWRWRSSCRTELGNIVFADDRRLFLLGSGTNPLYSDFIGTTDKRSIAFQWEMPWADFDQRVQIKHMRYVQLDTRGTAEFTMMMFVDELYMLDGLLIPNNAMTFVGGENGGYGNNGQPYGGGRRTSDQRLYAWVARGKLMKLRFEGVVDAPIRIVAISLMYQNGSIRR
jgi:hypothetical protein